MTDYRDMKVYVVPSICKPIYNQEIELAQSSLDHLADLSLADSTDGENRLEIDLLIGGNHYWKFVDGRIRRGEKEPVAIGTMLGWVLSGSMGNTNDSNVNLISGHVMTVQETVPDDVLAKELRRFWNLEALGVESHPTKVDDGVVKQFRESIIFDGSNYLVRLPWKPEIGGIPDNYTVSLGRLKSLLTRLRKTPKILEDCILHSSPGGSKRKS